jgi:hypothetical protein
LNFIGLYSTLLQKMELFTATDMKTSKATLMLIVIRANNYPPTVLGPLLLPGLLP